MKSLYVGHAFGVAGFSYAAMPNPIILIASNVIYFLFIRLEYFSNPMESWWNSRCA